MVIVHSDWHADSDSTALLSCYAHGTITVLQKQIKEPYIMNNLLIPNAQSLWENLESGPCCIDQAIVRSLQQCLGLRISVKAFFLVTNKYIVVNINFCNISLF